MAAILSNLRSTVISGFILAALLFGMYYGHGDYDGEAFGKFLFRWLHVISGVMWIGLLYYFNFVQTEYFKEAEEMARKDAVAKLAPRALWWFRWAAFFTFLTGLYLLDSISMKLNLDIIFGATMGTLMMLNVWGIIWPNQKVVIGIKEGDAATAGPKAALASRTNTLFSVGMLYFMVSSAHYPHGREVVGSLFQEDRRQAARLAHRRESPLRFELAKASGQYRRQHR